jgi:hypothetical protein
LAAGKMRQNYLSLVAFGIILQGHKQLPVCIFRNKIASLGSFKSFNGKYLKLTSHLKVTSKTFAFFNNWAKNIVKTISACTKSTSRDPIPLKKKAH